MNLTKLTTNAKKVTFWLNVFNFLTIFTIIFKQEILANRHEWLRFMKTSYYNIGGYEISLFEIENCILNKGTKNMYGQASSFRDSDIRTKFVLEEEQYPFVNFGISIPTK